jgi:hypothetical protein
MYTSRIFKDDKNELDFGEHFYAEVEVEIDYSYPSYSEWESITALRIAILSDSELTINEYSVNYLALKVKESKKLLQSFENKEEDIWESLTKEQQGKVYVWVGKKIKTQEIIDQLNEAAVDFYVDYQERRAEERGY